jgi:CheY-like chemotaxis protein
MRPRKTILCVDDNEQALSIRKFMLETRGYRVLTACHSDTALELFRETPVDLVLSDLAMPYMDGNELIRRMKVLSPEIPMILTSGCIKDFDRAGHADAFLPKGACTPLEVIERIKLLIARRRGPKKTISAAALIASTPVNPTDGRHSIAPGDPAVQNRESQSTQAQRRAESSRASLQEALEEYLVTVAV